MTLQKGETMREKHEIYMDFKRAKEAARELDEIADQMDQVANRKLTSAMDEVASVWECDEEHIFSEKTEQLRVNVNHNIQVVKKLADQIRSDARRIYEAELRACEIASRRSS